MRHPRRKLPVWSRRALKIDYLPLDSFLNWLLFSNPQNPQRFRSWRHSRPRSQFPSAVFIVTSLIVKSVPRARVNTCAQCVHLTNPCPKRKVLSISKPKAKKNKIILQKDSFVFIMIWSGYNTTLFDLGTLEVKFEREIYLNSSDYGISVATMARESVDVLCETFSSVPHLITWWHPMAGLLDLFPCDNFLWGYLTVQFCKCKP